LCCLQLEAYNTAEKHADDMIAEYTGLSVENVQEALKTMVAIGVLVLLR